MRSQDLKLPLSWVASLGYWEYFRWLGIRVAVYHPAGGKIEIGYSGTTNDVYICIEDSARPTCL